MTTNFEDLIKARIIMDNKDDPFYTFIVMSIITFLLAWSKDILTFLKGLITDYYNKKVKSVINNVKLIDKISEIYFERNYEKQDNWDKSDAILHKLLKIPSSQSVLVIGLLEVIKNKEVVNITPDIKFQLTDLLIKENQIVTSLSFKIFSEKLNVCELRTYLDELVEEYLINKKNNLGNRLYFFDQLVSNSLPGVIIFSKHQFLSTRTLDNVFHEKRTELKNRVEFFLHNKNWYNDRGIPHTLGLLFTGPPGCGKTSSIKAVAHVSKRHLININLAHIKTKKQLKKLFYDERIKVCENIDNPNQTIDYIIPIDKRVYVIEDIDTMDNDIVLRRDLKKVQEPPEDGLKFTREPIQEKSDLDLSTILNIFDGTLETPGRILIVTTNFPERLDEALIRPGRIDLLIEYKLCNRVIIKEMFDSFYSSNIDISEFSEIQEYKWSPAEVSQVLFKNFSSVNNCSQEVWNQAIKDLKKEKESLDSITVIEAIDLESPKVILSPVGNSNSPQDENPDIGQDSSRPIDSSQGPNLDIGTALPNDKDIDGVDWGKVLDIDGVDWEKPDSEIYPKGNLLDYITPLAPGQVDFIDPYEQASKEISTLTFSSQEFANNPSGTGGLSLEENLKMVYADREKEIEIAPHWKEKLTS